MFTPSFYDSTKALQEFFTREKLAIRLAQSSPKDDRASRAPFAISLFCSTVESFQPPINSIDLHCRMKKHCKELIYLERKIPSEMIRRLFGEQEADKSRTYDNLMFAYIAARNQLETKISRSLHRRATYTPHDTAVNRNILAPPTRSKSWAGFSGTPTYRRFFDRCALTPSPISAHWQKDTASHQPKKAEPPTTSLSLCSLEPTIWSPQEGKQTPWPTSEQLKATLR